MMATLKRSVLLPLCFVTIACGDDVAPPAGTDAGDPPVSTGDATVEGPGDDAGTEPLPPVEPYAPGERLDSELARIADALETGAWAELPAPGFGPDLIDACDGSHTIFEFANAAVWDPVFHRVSFVGQGHYSCMKHIRFDEIADTDRGAWTIADNPPTDGIGHAYDHNAIDPATGTIYYRNYGGTTIYRFDPRTETWDTPYPEMPLDYTTVAGALEFFPEMGGLVYINGRHGVWFLDTGDPGATWEQLSGEIEMGSYSNHGVYNAVHGVIWFGGGSSGDAYRSYRLNADGSIDAMAPAPIPLGNSNRQALSTTYDPVSGDYLVFSRVDSDDPDAGVYSYDIRSDRWNRLGDRDPARYPVYEARAWAISVPISTYGVILFATSNFDDSRVYLYRHSR